MNVNLTEVQAEVQRLCDGYEQALIANDVDKLKDYFWQSDHALRFGVTEELYGADDISEFRDQRKINFTERTPMRREVVTLGPDFAIATLEFSVLVQGIKKHGRQTQVWVRFEKAGWRIVSAHVSHKVVAQSIAQAYINAASNLQSIPIAMDSRDSVAGNIERMSRMVEPLLDFEFDDEVEPAPVFTP